MSAAVVDGLTQKGLVVRQHGRHVWVEDAHGERHLCHTRGKKNPCVVGDRVLWQPLAGAGSIETVLPRQTLLYRQDDMRTKQFAANMDQVLIMLASEPSFSEEWLLHALVACAAAKIEVHVVLNKSDLVAPHALAFARLAPYRLMGYGVDSLCIRQAPTDTLHALQRLLAHRKTLILGASGVGKSSLVQLLVPEVEVRTQALSVALGSGKHTTTQTTWYWLDAHRHSALIDSPGFQEFGLSHIGRADLPGYLPDFVPYLGQCRFHNCTHLHEPQCAVLSQVGKTITSQRHAIYARLFARLGTQRF